MNQNNDPISAKEAESALKSINLAKQTAEEFVKPPLWLNLFMSFLLGLITFASGLSSGNSVWAFVMLCSTLAALLTFTIYYFYLKGLGISLRLSPKSPGEKWINLVSAFMIAFVIVAAKELYSAGFTLAPFLAGLINAVTTLYLFTHFTFAGGKIERGKGHD